MTVPRLGTTDGALPFSAGETEANEKIRSAADNIGFSSTAVISEISQLAADRLFFFGTYSPGPTGEYGQFAESNYKFEDVDNLFFQAADANLTGYNQTFDVTQYIGLTGPRVFENLANSVFATGGTGDTVREANSQDVANTLVFANMLDRSYNTFDTMLTDVVTGGQSEDVFDYIEFNSVTDASNTVFERDENQIAIKDHVTFSITGASCPDKEYTPFVGSSGDTSYDPVSETPPTLGDGTLTLTHPYVTPTTTLVLKNPEFNNSDTITWTKIDRRTRGGTRKIFADTKWAKPQVFELSITNIDDSCFVTIDEIIDFLNTSLGEEIGLLDWEGRQWRGIISVPDTEVTPEVSGHRVLITFEGVLA